MAAYNKFSGFAVALMNAQINMSTSGHTFSLILSNTLPTSTFKTGPTSTNGTVDWTNISTGNGYAAQGSTCQIVTSTLVSSSLPYLVTGSTVVFTASVGTIGPFRYVGLMDQSTAYGGSPQLVSWYDYGSSITLNAGETFTVSFDASSGILQLS